MFQMRKNEFRTTRLNSHCDDPATKFEEIYTFCITAVVSLQGPTRAKLLLKAGSPEAVVSHPIIDFTLVQI